MAKYRKVDPRIWNDRKFMALSNNGKLAFFFMLTHPNMTALGAMRGTIPGLSAEIGWAEKAFREAFSEASNQGMVLHDEKASFFWLPNFMKYNRPESPNVVKAWVSSVDMLPECDLLFKAISKACECAEGLGKAFMEALPKDFAKAMPYPEQEQEHEHEQEQDKNLPPKGGLSPSAGDDTGADVPKIPSCPQQDIIALYHSMLPQCPKVKVWSDTSKGHLKARWRANNEYQSTQWWKDLFAEIAKSDFLTGKTQSNGGNPFVLSLSWLVKPTNFEKVVNGNYANKNGTPLQGKDKCKTCTYCGDPVCEKRTDEQRRECTAWVRAAA